MTPLKLHMGPSFVEQDFLYYKNNITENMKITVQNHSGSNYTCYFIISSAVT